MGETNANTKENLKFRGGIFMSLVPVAIFFGFCVVLFVIFKAFNMEALAMGGFVALLVGGVFCTSYTKFWDAAIKGISSITSVSVIVIFFVIGMFSALMKASGLSGGFVWLANTIGMNGGLFVAFTFFATCVVSTATGSSIGTMFTAFPIFFRREWCWWAAPCLWREPLYQVRFSVTIWRRSVTRPSRRHRHSSLRTAIRPM